jgi:GNAT superfamily N-acetyltransferase
VTGQTGPAPDSQPVQAPAIHAVIRRASAEDVPALRTILRAHGEDGPVAPGGADIVGPYLRHLVEHHTVLVAEDGDAVVAFGSAVDTGRARVLGDLFVLPDRLGRGIGRSLLAVLFGDAPARVTFSSADPRALPLYVRAGMTPLWPNLYVLGLATRLPDRLSGIDVRAAEPRELANLELAWTGADRAADHAFWGSQAGADAFVIEDAAEPMALGYGRSKQVTVARALDRLVIRPGVDPVAPAIAGLVRAARGGPVQASVLGPNPLLRILLEGGFRIVDSDQLLASDPSLVDPVRLLPNPGML